MRLQTMSACELTLLGLLAVTCRGCSREGDLPRQAVTGTVTLDWKPLASRMIRFEPSGPTKAAEMWAEVRDGRYSIPRDKGLVPGAYRATIDTALSGPTRADPVRRSGAGPISRREL